MIIRFYLFIMMLEKKDQNDDADDGSGFYEYLPSTAAKRTMNPIRGIVDQLQVTNTEKSFISLSLGWIYVVT